jgi:hypothetical protein
MSHILIFLKFIWDDIKKPITNFIVWSFIVIPLIFGMVWVAIATSPKNNNLSATWLRHYTPIIFKISVSICITTALIYAVSLLYKYLKRKWDNSQIKIKEVSQHACFSTETQAQVYLSEHKHEICFGFRPPCNSGYIILGGFGIKCDLHDTDKCTYFIKKEKEQFKHLSRYDLAREN